MPTVPEFSHIIVIGNLPAHVFSFNNNVFMLPAKANWCQTSKKGGESRLFKFSLEQTPALQALADVDIGCNGNLSPPMVCGKLESPCQVYELELEGNTCQGDCCDLVFGVRWSPGDFVKQAVSMGHPFSLFSGLPEEVKSACICVAESDTHYIINNRCINWESGSGCRNFAVGRGST